MHTGDDFEGALQKLAETGFEFGGGLSNHGPMAVEALHHLGHDEAIAPWLAGYLAKLDAPAEPRDLPPRLGEYATQAGWLQLFERELAEHDWREVVARWVPMLAPGVFAAAAHGLLRTAHAIRALREVDTPIRRAELARGLTYWALRFQVLPGSVRPRGRRSAADLLASLPVIPRSQSFLLSEGIRDIEAVPELPEHLSQLDPAELEPGPLLAALAPWAGGGAQVSVFAHVHVLTATVALLQLEDLLTSEQLHDLLAHAWHAVAAVIATWRPAAPLAIEGPLPTRDSLIASALACADEHAIKLADACLTAFDRFGEPSLLHAAAALIAGLSR